MPDGLVAWPTWAARMTRGLAGAITHSASRQATGGPVQWEAATHGAAINQATQTLARQGLVPLPAGRQALEPLVAHLTGLTLAQASDRPAPRPVDPFAVFARLPEERQRAVLQALPERARTVVQAAGIGVQPRELAAYRGQPVDVVARQYRVAERAIGDYFTAHPELYRDLRPKPEPARPDPARPRLRLSVS